MIVTSRLVDSKQRSVKNVATTASGKWLLYFKSAYIHFTIGIIKVGLLKEDGCRAGLHVGRG